MSTFDKETADAVIAANGRYKGYPQVLRIILYTNAFTGERRSYGLETERSLYKYAASQYIIDPEIYWSYK
jgi:hypothetical protein